MNGRTNVKTWLVMMVLVLGIYSATAFADIIYVDSDATGANDGSSWANAFNHLQDALDDATSGDEIWVAGGVYEPDEDAAHPNGSGSRNATFQLKNGVVIKGGYAGFGEPDPDAWDFELYETILSGDLNGDDGPDFANNGENSYHVVTGNWTNATAVLDGFTITAGNAGFGGGGGMFSYEGSPTLTNCTFSSNSAEVGGGMLSWNNSNLTLTNCTFSDNSAEWGGGMANWESSNPTLTNCTFSGNSAGEVGGGMVNYYSNPTLANCTFTGNSAVWNAGGMANWDYSSPTLTNCTFSNNSADSGGGMQDVYNSSPTLTNCMFTGNLALWGGGMNEWEYCSPTLTNCTFIGNSAEETGGGMSNGYYSNPTLTDCTFSGNSSGGDGGGGMSNSEYSNTTLTNCTFSSNSAAWEGGGMCNYGSTPTLTNCTFSGNLAENQGGGMTNNDSNPTLTNCTFSGNSATHGAGMKNGDFSNPTLVNCTFSGNSSDVVGGGMANFESSPTLTNCTFSSNLAAEGVGGGMVNYESSPTLTNCTFSGNSAEGGGGMWNEPGNPTLTNCTFSGNSAVWSGGGMNNRNGSSATIANCILWGNTAQNGAQIYNDGTSSTTVSYSDVQGDWPGTGNINADPCFVGPKFGEPLEAPIAHWRFDEGGGTVAYDSAGENDGTLINNPTWTTGQIDGALSFDGVDDYVDVGYIGECNELSIALWVNIDSLPHTWNSLFHNNGWKSDDVHFIICSNGRVEFALCGMPDQFSNFSFSSSTFGKWYHIAVVYDRWAKTVDFYINGQHDVRRTYSSTRSAVLGPLRIGGWDGGARNFDGRIDDLRLYNRALSAEEIRQFYQMDYHLLPGSPCIDAGDNTAVPAGVTTDLGGNPRFVDDPYTVDTGNGTPPIVDMGAYEHLRPPISIYVDEDAPGPIHDGLGWADAFNHLQDALAFAIPGDEIRVAEGTYMPDSNSDEPDGTRNREATFQLINGVGLYGGYAGYGEPDPNERDVELYETILSGDLNGDDGPDFANNGENSYHVVTGSGINATAVLDGFIITGGNANGSLGNRFGGGMYNYTGSPTVSNCTFSENSAGRDGGGMCNLFNSNPTVTNCTFSRNSAVGNDGGGMNNNSSSPTITNCTFNGNSAYDWGGAIRNVYSSSPTITNCTFTGNSADDGGGMLNHSNSSLTLVNCTFTGNEARYGGGMVNYSNSNSSPTVTNCTFSKNSARYNGGGMNNRSSSPTLTNCTFSGNSANRFGGGMDNRSSSSPTVTNCILWGNTAQNGSQIYNDGTSSATVSYSCVQGYVEPTEPPTQGLISYWRFDEGEGTVAYDSAGDNHGTVYGAQWTTGKVGDALRFDGVDDCVSVEQTFTFHQPTDATLLFWIKPDDDVHRSIFWTRGDDWDENRFNFYSGCPGYCFGFDYREATGAIHGLCGTPIPANQWVHIGITRSGNTYYLYKEGEYATQTTDMNPYLPTYTGNWYIGRREGFMYKGLIGEVRIYDTALSTEEVEQLYQYGLNQGNIAADPRFLDVSGGDLRLLPTSPCIDAGDNTAVPADIIDLDGDGNTAEPIPFDLGGNLRFVDQPEVPDTGNGTAPIVDMGAFEADYIQAQMEFTPKVLNPKSKAKWIKAHLVLPEGFVVEDVNTNSPARIVEPFMADSNYMEVFLNEANLVEIMAAFDRADFCSNGSAHGDIVVIAQLTTGQYFYGTDTIRIKTNNLEYLAVLTSHWLAAGCGAPDWCGGADLNRDSVVDFIDFAFFDGCCIEVIEE